MRCHLWLSDFRACFLISENHSCWHLWTLPTWGQRLWPTRGPLPGLLPPFRKLRLICLNQGNTCYLKDTSLFLFHFCSSISILTPGRQGNDLFFSVSLVSRTRGWHIGDAQQRVAEWLLSESHGAYHTPQTPPSRCWPSCKSTFRQMARPAPLAARHLGSSVSPFMLLDKSLLSLPTLSRPLELWMETKSAS